MNQVNENGKLTQVIGYGWARLPEGYSINPHWLLHFTADESGNEAVAVWCQIRQIADGNIQKYIPIKFGDLPEVSKEELG